MTPRETLIRARTDRGLSLHEAATNAGLGLYTVERAEMGLYIRMKTARTLAEFYDRPIAELFPDWVEHGGRFHRNGDS